MRASNATLGTFRLHLALTVAIVTGSFALIIAAALFAPLFVQLERGDLDRAAVGALADYLLYLHASYWPVVAGMILASIACGMILFRRMTSPLIRFVRVFEQVGRGEIPRAVRIRRTDYLHAEALAVNRMVAALAERASADERDLGRLDAALEELEGLEGGPKAAAAITAVREAAGCLRERVASHG